MVDIDQLGLDDGALLGILLRRFYEDLLELAFEDASGLLAVDLAFDLDLPEVQEVLGDLLALARRIPETTKDQIRELIGRQAAEGWSAERLADEIVAAGATASQDRALTIAVTETASAYSRGSMLAYARSGVVERVEWLTITPEERACPVCKPLNGKQVDLGAEFAEGIPHPPAHPMCRCAIAPVIE